MTYTPCSNERFYENSDRAAEADNLECLVADIKSTIESCFSDESKVKLIHKAIQKAGY